MRFIMLFLFIVVVAQANQERHPMPVHSNAPLPQASPVVKHSIHKPTQ